MGLNLKPHSNIRPQASVKAMAEAPKAEGSAKILTYEIEQFDVPSGLSSFKLRRVIAMTEKMLADEPVGILAPSERSLYDIARNLVAQIKTNQRK